MTVLLVDSDSLLYRAGFVCNELDQESLAKWQLDGIIKGLLENFTVSDTRFFISGSENFRYKIYPEYKANRKGMKRPIHLNALREHIVSHWGAAISTDGREADDDVGIASYEQDVIIAHLDKDLNTLPGDHYNYNKQESYSVSPLEAFRNFYTQMLMGDRADNIPGYDTKMRQKAPKFMSGVMTELAECRQPEEMFDLVLGWYSEDLERFDISARCLWIHRRENDDWLKWINGYTMKDVGRQDAFEALSQARLDEQARNGLPGSKC